MTPPFLHLSTPSSAFLLPPPDAPSRSLCSFPRFIAAFRSLHSLCLFRPRPPAPFAFVGAELVKDCFCGRYLPRLLAPQTDAWYTLGTGDISGDIGPGGGAGRIRLKLCYWPLEMLKQQFGAWAAGPQRGSAEWSQEERISQCESVVTARAISEQQLHVRRPRVSRNKRGQSYNQSVASLPRSRLGAPSEAGSAPTYPGRATQPRRRCHAAHPGPLVASHVSPEAAARPVYAPTPIPNGDERPPQRGVLFLLLVG